MMSLPYCCYSVILGNYDQPPNVVDPDPRIKFFLLSDSLTSVPHPWQLVNVENYFRDPKITTGFLKSNPEMMFGRCPNVAWVDGNLRDLKIDADIMDRWLSSAPIASIPHRVRNSAADELIEVLHDNLEDDISSMRLMAEMRDAGFNADSGGLSATMLLVRNLSDHRVRRADKIWWDAIRSGARRDQISFEFAVWSAGLVSTKIDVDWREPNSLF
jgi:hypothetical protein